MALKDTDLLIVSRDGVNYKITVEEFRNGLNFLGKTTPLTLVPEGVSNPLIYASSGDDVTITCEYSCPDTDAIVSYRWFGIDQNLISGAVYNSLVLYGVVPASSGNYSCEVLASSDDGVGSLTRQFTLTVT